MRRRVVPLPQPEPFARGSPCPPALAWPRASEPFLLRGHAGPHGGKEGQLTADNGCDSGHPVKSPPPVLADLEATSRPCELLVCPHGHWKPAASRSACPSSDPPPARVLGPPET